MGKHQILEFTTVEGMRLFIDAERIEAVVEAESKNAIDRCQIVTGSDTYNVRGTASGVAMGWRESL